MLLECDLRVRYPRGFCLSQMRLALRKGEVIGLIGESGSGKTTLAHSLLGLAPKSARIDGSIRISGTDLLTCGAARARAVRRKCIGYIPQDAASCFSPYRTLRRQFWTFWKARTGGRDQSAFALACAEALQAVGLDQELLERYPQELSIGQAQRAAIANAALSKPELLIADEPTSALDLLTAADVLRYFEGFKARGVAMLLVTHDLGTALALADQIIVLKDGRVLEQQPTQSFVDRPKDAYSRALLAAFERTTAQRRLLHAAENLGAASFVQ